MLRRSSYIVAAASVAAQSGPAAAVLLCDEMFKEMGREGEPVSEREIILARAAAAGRGEKKRRAWRLPRVSLRGIVAGLRLRKPRLAA